MIAGDREKPWVGCAPQNCRFKLGELVGFAPPCEDKFRIGVVLAQPPTPEAAPRGHLTIGDNVYLVGMLDKDGSPVCIDHAHVAEPLLFPVHELAPETRAALKKKSEAYRR
jgi:hypothetical protein